MTTSHIRDERHTVSRIIRRLIPFLCLLFIVNYLDRTNIAMAKLKMLGDAHLDEEIYGFGAGLFFIGYFIFEVPSNIILEKVGARRWIARIMITWGIVSSAMMYVHGPTSFYAMRFLLGVAEAGFFPGIVLYLTHWVPSSQRASVLALFLTSTAICGIIGNPLAGLLMKMDGIGGMHGWQWLFLIEGIIPIVLGVVTWVLLPDHPRDARWLSIDEKQWIEAELAREQAQHQHHVAELRHALPDARLWLLSALYFCLIMGLYGFVYWVPTIIKSVTSASDVGVGFLSAIPSLVGAVTMVIIAKHADKTDERRWHVAVCAVIAATGVALVCICHSLVEVELALALSAVGIFGTLAPFWALATRFLRGSAAAAGIAIVNSIGALAGFVAPSIIGWAKQSTGKFTYGLLAVSISLAIGALLVMIMPRGVDRDCSSQ